MKDLFEQEAPGCDFTMLQKMVEAGDIRAYSPLALCYIDKVNGTEQDYEKGLEILKLGAKKREDNCMADLWRIFYGKQDMKTAKYWSTKMHALHLKNHEKHPSLQTEFDLAFDIQYGFGCEKNGQEARKRMESLAKRGFGNACYSLGLMFENGIGCRKNRPAALRRYLKGAELGEPNCMLIAAQHYLDQGDQDKYFELISTASRYKYGWSEAQLEMGNIYLWGNRGKERDWEKAEKYFAAAKSLGNYEAAVYLHAMQTVQKECLEIYESIEEVPLKNWVAKLSLAIAFIFDNGLPE